jgi:hypothetical protein
MDKIWFNTLLRNILIASEEIIKEKKKKWKIFLFLNQSFFFDVLFCDSCSKKTNRTWTIFKQNYLTKSILDPLQKGKDHLWSLNMIYGYRLVIVIT